MPHRTAKQIATISAVVGLAAGGAAVIVQTSHGGGHHHVQTPAERAAAKGQAFNSWQAGFERTATYRTANSSTDPCELASATQAARVDPANVPPVDPGDWASGFAALEQGFTEACESGTGYDFYSSSPSAQAAYLDGFAKLTDWKKQVRAETNDTASIHTNNVWPDDNQ